MASRNPKEPKRPKDDNYKKPEPYEEQPGAVRVHQAYLEHRLAGGEPATPEAYRRAVEQFQKLPGAMRSVPPAAPPEKPTDETKRPADDEEKGESQ